MRSTDTNGMSEDLIGITVLILRLSLYLSFVSVDSVHVLFDSLRFLMHIAHYLEIIRWEIHQRKAQDDTDQNVTIEIMV